jgi:hypothetical protein
MAALPPAAQVSSKVLLRNERAADIAQLQVSLQLPDLEYVDICAQLELRSALQRWPLLAELSEVPQPEMPLHEEAVLLLELQVAK